MNKFSIKYALSSIRVDPIRTILTLLGIVIGVATAVLIVGVGQGVIHEVDKTLSNFGSDILAVVPSANPFKSGLLNVGKLTKEDVKAIKSCTQIKDVAYTGFLRTLISYDRYSTRAVVYTSTANIFSMYGDYFQVESGRFYRDDDGRVAFLGWEAAHTLFPKDVYVGKRINISGKAFRVIGIAKRIGTSISKTDDQAILIPYKTAKRELFQGKDEISFIMAKTMKDANMSEAKGCIERALCRSHSVSCENKDFSVITQEYIKKRVDDILSAVYTGALAVGLIASLVSGVGIANTMYTSVFRRKRELGLLKALGATNKSIMAVVLIEAILLGLAGSILGLLLGISIGFIISSYAPFIVHWSEGAVALITGLLMGLIGGYLPAKKATSLSPLEAINY